MSKMSGISNRNLPKILLAFALTFFPFSALANVAITEIMYDASGSDAGHEWVEIQNTGTQALSLSGFRFAQGGVNHKLAAQRSSVLNPGEYAIIANSAANFSADYPSYSGALFQSSFSLGNTGETIALKDASSTELASATYASSAGANGDGNSLNFINGAWVPRAPSPGAAASASAIVPPSKAAPTPKPVKSSKASGNPTVIAAVKGGNVAAVASVAQTSGFSSILPWILGLSAVVMVGAGALFLMSSSKKPETDGYTIIEDK